MLFCPGIPGAGKTFLTSIVVNDLQERHQHDPDVGIAYLYCNYKRQAEQRIEIFIGSLIKQLVQGRPDLLTEIQLLYQDHRRKGTRPSLKVGLRDMCIVPTPLPIENSVWLGPRRNAILQRIWKKIYSSFGAESYVLPRYILCSNGSPMATFTDQNSIQDFSSLLRSITQRVSRVFIAVDALDECADSQVRSKLLKEIKSVQSYNGDIKLFATSRYTPEITTNFQRDLSVEIRATDGDVRRYLENHMADLPLCVHRSQALQDAIVTEIIRAVDGM